MLAARTRLLALACFLLLPLSGIAAQENSCDDAYWAETLRCVDAVDPSTLVPQPEPLVPSTAGELKDYTRISLDGDDTVRCLDGTLPLIYVDPAVGGPSDDWVFTFQGGGSCWAAADAAGQLIGGQLCVDKYVGGERGEMGTANEPAMKNLGVEPGVSGGIHSPDPSLNPVFSRFNRVRVEKCGYDRHAGRSTRRVEAEHPYHGPVEYVLFQHGQRIVRQALETLRGGIEFDTWVEDGAGGVTTTRATLPPLGQAQRVLIVGHSGSAHGLVQVIDRIHDGLDGWEEFGGDVRFVYDANFLPGPENEAAFNDPSPVGDAYDHRTDGTSFDVAPVTGVYDESYYSDPDSRYSEPYISWSQMRDQFGDRVDFYDFFDDSCVDAHPGEEWRCIDRFHVLMNHVTTPLLVREDFTDPSGPHTAGGAGHIVEWGEWGDYPHCLGLQGETPCAPLLDLTDHRERLHEQRRAFAEEFETRSELASSFDVPGSGEPADPSAEGQLPSRFFYFPDCGSHAGAYNSFSFSQTLVRSAHGTRSMRQLLERFVMQTPPSGATETWSVEVDGGAALCPPSSGAGVVPSLEVDKNADGSVTLSWSPSCVASDTDYAIYDGRIGAFASHELRRCSTGGATSQTLEVPGAARYFLVVPHNTEGEGSYGRDSDGLERQQGPRACLPQRVSRCDR